MLWPTTADNAASAAILPMRYGAILEIANWGDAGYPAQRIRDYLQPHRWRQIVLYSAT